MLAALVATAALIDVPLLASFGFGIVLFEAVRLWRLRVAAPAALALLAAGVFLGGIPYDIDYAGGGLYAWLWDTLAPWIGVIQLITYRLAAVCFVAAVLLWPGLQRLLLTRVSQWLGRVSFMLYLVHVPILCSLGAGLLVLLAPRLGYDAATVVVLPCYLAAALAVAGVTTRLIDEPSIRLARRVGRRLWTLVNGFQRLLPLAGPGQSPGLK